MKAILFTTLTCPKCPSFKEFVNKQEGLELEFFDDTKDGFFDKAQAMQITTVPTLVIFEGEKEVFRTSDEGELNDYLKNK